MRSIPSVWFSMPTDNGLSVCALEISPRYVYKPLWNKHFIKSLTVWTCLRKDKVRPKEVSRTGRESVRGQGCIKEYAFSPGGPNPRFHTQRLRGRNTKAKPQVGGSNPPPASHGRTPILTGLLQRSWIEVSHARPAGPDTPGHLRSSVPPRALCWPRISQALGVDYPVGLRTTGKRTATAPCRPRASIQHPTSTTRDSAVIPSGARLRRYRAHGS